MIVTSKLGVVDDLVGSGSSHPDPPSRTEPLIPPASKSLGSKQLSADPSLRIAFNRERTT